MQSRNIKNKSIKNVKNVKKYIWIGSIFLILILVCFYLKPLLKSAINKDYVVLNKTANEVILGSKDIDEFNIVLERFNEKYNRHLLDAYLSDNENIVEYWVNVNQSALDFSKNVNSRDKLFCFKDSIVSLVKKFSISNSEMAMERLRKLINNYTMSAKNKDVAGIIDQYPEVYREFNMLLPMLRRTEAIEIGLLLDRIYKLGFSNKPDLMPESAVELSDVFYSQYFSFEPVFEQ